MAVKIRLARRGRKQRPFYHIVVADARAPRDGRFIENIGSYNPMTVPASIELDREKAFEWLEKGAQPTETVRSILRFKGVLYKKHLQRGVKKGAMTQEVADKLLAEWIEAKDSKIQSRREKIAEERVALNKKLTGFAPIVKEDKSEVEEAAEAFREEAVEAVKEEVTPAVVEAAPKVVTEVTETKSEAVAEKAEAAPAAAKAVEAVAEVVETTPEVVEAISETAETVASEETASEEE
jgi:small subunit ribosomal protein S16